jgi:hypothetical protein
VRITVYRTRTLSMTKPVGSQRSGWGGEALTAYSIVVTVLTEMQKALQDRMEYSKEELQQILDDPIAESMAGMSRFATISSTTKVRLLALAELITRDWKTHEGKFSIAYTLNVN